jgi:hypothetical protein
MPIGLASLSAVQRSKFEAMQTRLRLRPDQLAHAGTLKTSDYGGTIVLTTELGRSHVEPVLVPFHSMGELKQLVGVADEHYATGVYSDRLIAYPPQLDPARSAFLQDSRNICDLRTHLTPDEHSHLLLAAQAYLTGNSAKVADYVPLMDAHFAPGTLAVFAGDSLHVEAGQTVQIQSPDGKPVALNYASIQVDDGGQIIVLCAASITTQTFTASH